MSGGNKCIRVDESTDSRVIVTGLEVIEPGFVVVVVGAITEGVDVGHLAILVEDIAPSIVLVECDLLIVTYPVDTDELTIIILQHMIIVVKDELCPVADLDGTAQTEVAVGKIVGSAECLQSGELVVGVSAGK